MRNSTVTILRKTAILLVVLLSFVSQLTAQVDVSIGTGTTGNGSTSYPCPLQDYYEGTRAQYLFTAAELRAAGMGPGMISGLKINVTNLQSGGKIEQYAIKLGTTTAANLDLTSWVPTGSNLYGPVDYTPVVGVNTFNFVSSFFWNGTDNLVVEVCNGDPATNSGLFYTNNPLVPWTSGLPFVASHTYRADDEDNLCGTLSTSNSGDENTRPNLTFRWTAAAPCTGTPTAGTAQTNTGAVCIGGTFTLSLTGTTVASGLTYQWQSSPAPGGTWTNINGATNSNYTGTQTASTVYRCVVTCTTGGATATSSTVTVTSPIAVSGTFTINKALPTGGTNFASFNDAYNHIKCGIGGPVIFNVAAGSGPYNEQLIMTPVPGASATNTVTFNGNADTLAFLSTASGQRAVIKLDGADYIKFDNLVIQAKGTSSSEYGYGVQLINDADFNTISNCKILINTTSTNTGYAGIVISSSHTSPTTTGAAKCDNNTFSNNTVIGGYYGFVMVGSINDANGNNKVVNNKFTDFYNYGAYLSGSFNALVEANTFSRPARTTVTSFYGVYLTDLNTKALITRNRITNPYGGATTNTGSFYGIYFTSVDALSSLENYVTNNLIYGLNGNGDHYGIYNSSSDNVWFLHNTISLDAPSANSTNSYVTRGYYQTSQADGVNFVNNLISISRGGQSSKTAIHFTTTSGSYVVNRNDYFISSTTGTVNIGFYNNAAQATLANWQTASSFDANSMTVNPFFEDPTVGNYKPTSASLDNRGTNADVAVDILNVTRSTTTPDIGAYEYTPAPCTVPPVGGTTTVSKTPVCINTSVSLGVTGASMGLGQTYQWQTATSAGGPFTAIGNVLNIPDTIIVAATTLYYRVALTCNGNTAYSTPVLLTVDPALPAGTYTINKALPTGGTNYTSFDAARIALQCGIAGPVVFNVVPNSGPYNEQLVLDSIAGVSAVNTITFNGNGNVIKFSSSNTDERAVIKLRRADYIRFDSLTIDATGTGSYGYGVQLINNADNNIFTRNKIIINNTSTSSAYSGIIINATESGNTSSGSTLCDNNVFDKNTVTGGYYGATLVGGSDLPVTGNKFINNDFQDVYYYGIYLSYASNTLVEGNSISRPTRTSFGFSYYAIYVSTAGSPGLTISKNKIFNPYGGDVTSTNDFYGIYYSYADAVGTSSIVANNIMYNINGSGSQYGLYNASSDNVKYYHNTISLDNVSNNSTAISRGFYQTSDASDIDFKNNIITITRGGTGSKHAIYLSSDLTGIAADYNNYYVKGGGTDNNVGYNGTSQPNLAAWQAASNKDANSTSIDPVYADATTGNLASVISPMDNTGTPIPQVTSDILGTTRSTTKPDVGAFEISIPACTAPPTGGTSVAIPNSGICLGTEIALNLTGNSSGGTQTYQWQSAPSATSTTWTDISDPLFIPNFKTELGQNNYFRCKITCSGQIAYSAVVHVNMNPALLAGVYTINPALPTGAKNYQSFTAAVAALECGITGAVIFNVAAGTYTEQIRMHKIAGAGVDSRVTFQSATNDASSVTLTFAPASATNYVLKLDSASYITYRDITFKPTGSTNARAVELANLSAEDSLVNNKIVLPVTNSTGTGIIGIYANNIKGKNNVFKGNTITNGSSGIYYAGASRTLSAPGPVIDSNIISGSYTNAIYTNYTYRLVQNNNRITLSSPLASTAYGINNAYTDSSYQVTRNDIKISNTASSVYGIYMNTCEAQQKEPGNIANNKINALTGITGTLYGLANYYSKSNQVVNNVVSIKTNASSSYALYSYNSANVNYYNNSIQSTATSSTNNVAGYFYHSSSTYGNIVLRNNIFTHGAGGNAMYVYNSDNINSDYNTLYTTGTILVKRGTPAANYNTLQAWRDAAILDLSSIVYKPAFVNDEELKPDAANPESWAIHGRGVQVVGNDRDFNNNPRPTTLTTGVPDMGAYEFLPSVLPPVLPATPATPAAGTTQTFMFGTDTVTKIIWAPGANVPTEVNVRRYSGVIPPALPANSEHLYFYTDVDATGTGPYKFEYQLYYVDSWQGFVKKETDTRLGRTDAANTWQVRTTSKVDDIANVVSETDLTYLDKFTGLTGGTTGAPPILQPADSSNRGTRFWVGYGHHQFFGSDNTQSMVLYLSAEAAANVTVKINGTAWVKRYHIPANSVISSDLIPKNGLFDARLLAEGLSSKGISIESDTPIVAYAHIYGSASSGATMLLPVGTYGYEYYSLGSRQNYGSNTYSWLYVIADQDNTAVEITPARQTLGGRAANVPFVVNLNKGEVYQVLGAIQSGSEGYDLSGSRIRSVQNADGRCFPVAVFSGSSRTSLGCGGSTGGSGDNYIQQNFPSQAWGRNYLTAPTSQSDDATVLSTNIFRVLVKDPTTVVKRNGVALTGLINSRFYQYESNTADHIESDKPVMIAQFMSSSGSCPDTNGDGDPEMIYVSPVEQGIKKVGLYRNTKESIDVNYLTLIIPDNGLTSLTIDGTNVFDHVYAHPNMTGYKVVVKRWDAAQAQCIVQSDSAFTAITYGMGSVESYGYNAGTLVKNLNILPSFNNVFSTGETSKYTCAKTPFRFSLLVSTKPQVLTWQFSKVAKLTPNVDVVQNDPVPDATVVVNGKTYYRYSVAADYVFAAPGTYYVPIIMKHPDIESCGNSLEIVLPINVVAAPVVDFTTAYSGCIGDVAQFDGTVTTSTGVGVSKWNWDFADNTTATIKNPTKTFTTPGPRNVKLSIIAAEGCIGDTIKEVVVNAPVDVALVKDFAKVCVGTDATFSVQSPVSGVTYNWYDAPTGGTLLGTGVSYTVSQAAASGYLYVESVKAGCIGATRAKATIEVLPLLATPVVTVDSIGVNTLRFKWAAIPNAQGYEVSTDGGTAWSAPSSGSLGLTHTITGLRPAQSVTLIVKAKGCEDKISAPVTEKTLPDGIFIPNAFTPNGDGLNDELKVYGYIIREMHLMIFNQWGEKVFETNTQGRGWDGTFKGKPAPSGVYIYVCRVKLIDGSTVDKKGSINLLR